MALSGPAYSSYITELACLGLIKEPLYGTTLNSAQLTTHWLPLGACKTESGGQNDKVENDNKGIRNSKILISILMLLWSRNQVSISIPRFFVRMMFHYLFKTSDTVLSYPWKPIYKPIFMGSWQACQMMAEEWYDDILLSMETWLLIPEALEFSGYTFRLKQNGHHFADDIFQVIFFEWKILCILIWKPSHKPMKTELIEAYNVFLAQWVRHWSLGRSFAIKFS